MLILPTLIVLKFSCIRPLLKNTVAYANNTILRNAAIVMPLKYLSNFWMSLEMSLINCKVELKIKWTNILFCIQLVQTMLLINILIISFLLSKTQNYMFLQYLYQQETIKNNQKFFAKALKDQFVGMNIKQKYKKKWE